MKITIITVSFNSVNSIECAMGSVLSQSALGKGLTKLEYLIIDGGSRDGTVARAESFRDAFERLGATLRIVSEPDGGIYDAMNKGIRLATGDVIGILNSDDWYEPDALETVCATFRESGCDLMFANIRMHRADGSVFIKKARQRKHYQTSRDWNHPTTFVRAQLYKQYPFANLGIHDDYGFYLKMRRLNAKIVTVDRVLANFRMGGVSNRRSLAEAAKRIRDRYRYCYRMNGYGRWYLIECVVIEAAKMCL